MQWLNAVVVAIWTLSQLMVFVLVYQGLKRKLDLPRNLVAVVAILLYLYDFVRVASSEGIRFTHWGFHEWMVRPLFLLAGAEITLVQILEMLLLISLAYSLTRYAIELRRHTEMELELESAREVQQVLIPEELPEFPGYAIQGVYHPAKQVGGDFFQIIPLEDQSILVTVGDVSGKGLKAVMNVALIVGAVRTLAESDSRPASVLTGLNRRLCGRLQGGFATAVVLTLDRACDCILANAGHLPPFLNSGEMPIVPSLPVGIVPEVEYEEHGFTLRDNDRLTLYTDGVLEACNSARELYGFERIKTLLTKRPDASTIAETARGFGQEDDITVLTITRLPVIQNLETTSVGVATR
jgi:serine phosphatase RsbU (regulator of sigma subunit)